MTDQTALEVHGVAKHFGGVVAIREISMKITAGKTLAIIGQNGSGKTTLINIITGIYAPTCGKVRLGERDITGLDLASIARLGISRTFQNLRLFEALSGLDNVLLGLTGRQNHGVLSALLPLPQKFKAAQGSRRLAHDLMGRLGIDHLADVTVRDLSHGDRRRVEIARALICDPSVIALDEPTAGLTVDEGDRLVGVLDDIRSQGKAILIIEHNLRIVGAAADEVLIMHAGVGIASGRLDDVLADQTVRDTYIGTVA